MELVLPKATPISGRQAARSRAVHTGGLGAERECLAKAGLGGQGRGGSRWEAREPDMTLENPPENIHEKKITNKILREKKS